MPHPIPPEETRSIEQLRQQYDVERELARRLHEAPDTRGLYSAVYDEFLRRVPHHPAVAQKSDAATQAAVVALQLRLLEPFLASRPRYLEVGSGDCALAIELSRRLPRVIAVEAGSEILSEVGGAGNVEIVVSDTPPYPLPDASVDLAFSSHVIEHLTPRDALLHLRDIRRLLAPGGAVHLRHAESPVGPARRLALLQRRARGTAPARVHPQRVAAVAEACGIQARAGGGAAGGGRFPALPSRDAGNGRLADDRAGRDPATRA